MKDFMRSAWFTPALLFFTFACFADEIYIVDHIDPIEVDADLSLAELIDQTLEKYPDVSMLAALKREAEALQSRAESWLAAAPSVSLYYLDDAPGSDFGAREFEGALELPLWNWGQRQAGQQVADKANQASESQEKFIKFQVAGLVRQTIWDVVLQNSRYQMAMLNYSVAEKLLATVKRRVDLGDLPRSDFLLAKSEMLNKRSQRVVAEAERMHARKRFASLTQNNKMPKNFVEQQNTTIRSISATHPALTALNNIIARKKAELEWVKAAGSGQTVFAIGGKTERGNRQDQDTDSITFNLSVPFGGGAHLAPDIAAANLQLTETITKRDHMHRQLLQDLHEAQHALQVDRAELGIATELKTIAEAHFKLTQLSFQEGEIDLMDLLKIQARTQQAQRLASEQAVILQRDIALFNQAIGVLP